MNYNLKTRARCPCHKIENTCGTGPQAKQVAVPSSLRFAETGPSSLRYAEVNRRLLNKPHSAGRGAK
ncbi:MAG: hypothetical protein JXB29_08595 [Sedimentisphaerales bacterium]|nr:hypothetical protein [Sedimentisphaerales bacterium]